MSDKSQERLSRIGGLNEALQRCLTELTELYGSDAKTKLRAIRDEVIRKLKQSNISADRELEHAEIVRPAVEAIEAAFEGFV